MRKISTPQIVSHISVSFNTQNLYLLTNLTVQVRLNFILEFQNFFVDSSITSSTPFFNFINTVQNNVDYFWLYFVHSGPIYVNIHNIYFELLKTFISGTLHVVVFCLLNNFVQNVTNYFYPVLYGPSLRSTLETPSDTIVV